jgi:hypothetical protein
MIQPSPHAPGGGPSRYQTAEETDEHNRRDRHHVQHYAAERARNTEPRTQSQGEPLKHPEDLGQHPEGQETRNEENSPAYQSCFRRDNDR